MKLKNAQIYAHRGARTIAPENTLPAFQAALDMGVAGIELDVHCSSDGQLVVIHDFTVDQLTSGTGPVGRYSANALNHIDAGSHFDPAFSHIGVPTLEQVLDLIGDRCVINVEIKSMDPYGGDQVEPLLATIQDRNLYEQILVSSFNPVTLIKTRWLDPKVRLGLLHERPLPEYLQAAWTDSLIQPQALHPHYSLVDSAYMQWASTLGCAVNTWTVNDSIEAQRLVDLGVDVIMSDIPDVIADCS